MILRENYWKTKHFERQPLENQAFSTKEFANVQCFCRLVHSVPAFKVRSGPLSAAKRALSRQERVGGFRYSTVEMSGAWLAAVFRGGSQSTEKYSKILPQSARQRERTQSKMLLSRHRCVPLSERWGAGAWYVCVSVAVSADVSVFFWGRWGLCLCRCVRFGSCVWPNAKP